MTKTTVAAALGVIALGASYSGAQEPPALEAPLEAPAEPISGSPPDPPPAERPRPAEATSSRPLLLIPGVTVPPSRRTAQKPKAEAETSRPSLDAPIAEPEVQLRLESIRDEAAPADRSVPPSTTEKRRDGRSPGLSANADSSRETPSTESDGDSTPPSTTGKRRDGRFPGLSANADSSPETLTIESIGDPAVEAAVKRRVEKQIHEALGDRVKDVEVRVSGRSVLMRARASRFWHRWGARRTLETLALPPGYRGRAVVE